MNLTEHAFNKPSFEIDNIFHIGSKSNYFPAAFINIKQKRLFFRFTSELDFIDSPHFDNLQLNQTYNISLYKTQNIFKVTINDEIIYNEQASKHENVFNQSLYLSNEWNNPASANVSNFIFISSQKQITQIDIEKQRLITKFQHIVPFKNDVDEGLYVYIFI